jgi:phosphatidylserine/phosphatidylglycerophosphate/cardiolipin synthase-like enzyme
MRAAMVIAVALGVTGCASLPPNAGRPETSALSDTSDTRLGRAIAPLIAAHPGKSGIHAMPIPTDAFAARIVLADLADKSLDVQYYIWHGDDTGNLLFEALWKAAERGVRVRVLLDDANTQGLDELIATFDAHPNIEVRLYNPFASRGSRAAAYLTDFTRLNRRMHNKSFTADNQAAVVGGRNIGDEYFGAGDEVMFADLDVVAVGDAVANVSKEFDLYWSSASAYPAAGIVGPAAPGAAGRLRERFAQTHADPGATQYIDAVRQTSLVRALLTRTVQLEWTEARVVRDDPAKTLDREARKEVLLLSDLAPYFGHPERSFDLVSPYFVPGKEGTEWLGAMARRGVAVRILTNSLAATDVGPVHAGYSKHREELLTAGVRLYELKPTADVEEMRAKRKGRAGGSKSSPESLHAKTFALDRKRIFVGSFNFDQRSAHLNTEMGLVIESEQLAGNLGSAFDNRIPDNAYEVRLKPNRGLEWIERTAAGEVRHDDEPQSSALRRAWVRFLSWLPIDWLL